MPASFGPLCVVGSINIDVTASVERLPAPGETVLGGALRREPGGKGANQAVAAARLGARVRMIGAVGDDTDGQRMLQNLADAGVDPSGIWLGDTPTGTALITVDETGENQIVVCPGANDDVTADAETFSDDEAVLVQLEIPMATVEAVAASVSGFFVVNAAPAQSLPPEVVARADLVIVNETEYALLPELSAARLVAVTYGSAGAALVRDGVEIVRVPAPRVQPVSAVGAGDAFCAALTLGLHAGWEPELALTAACAVGADAVTHPESQPPLRGLAAYT
ncbi:ribokinase [Microbacterium sp. cx-55]|uniref:ribokinase n=1 Tax=unclassified Microbacterium TaxID=2609290 RepID=UPI001CBCBCAB|nr:MULTISPECIES: ribokinase [unclassified Microbacterium]MBZ4488454.1 ribokinase [Microbacterium sp. cx-55]MCC4909484.1 ribokinase [Microbacterium sp. cx-59]UGB35100.1 ribokinase [Microbacterium sp. cx-55]